MSTIYNFAKQNNLIQSALPGGKWAGVASPLGSLAFMDGGPVDWTSALIDAGKAVTSLTVQSLTPDEVNAIISKLDMIYRAPEHQDLANMVAEEILNILCTVCAVKWQTQGSFGGILAQGTQLDIWPLRPLDVGGILLSPGAPCVSANATGLYGASGTLAYTWTNGGVTAGTTVAIVPAQTMWQYAGMIYLGGFEPTAIPKISGIQFALAGSSCPPQPVTYSFHKNWGSVTFEPAFTRFEKPVIIPPLKQQTVTVVPDVTGSTDFELIALVVAQAQNKLLTHP
jgi:hypothetical protein